MIRNVVIVIESLKDGPITYIHTKNLGLEKVQHKLRIKRALYNNKHIYSYNHMMIFKNSKIVIDNRPEGDKLSFFEWLKTLNNA